MVSAWQVALGKQGLRDKLRTALGMKGKLDMWKAAVAEVSSKQKELGQSAVSALSEIASPSKTKSSAEAKSEGELMCATQRGHICASGG